MSLEANKGYVYLLKCGEHFKIGKARRHFKAIEADTRWSAARYAV